MTRRSGVCDHRTMTTTRLVAPSAGRWPRLVRRTVLGTLLVALLVVGGTGFRVWQVARVDDRAQADVVIVLGTAQYNGTPSPAFEARLRHAKTLYDEGVAKRIITTGGRRANDV